MEPFDGSGSICQKCYANSIVTTTEDIWLAEQLNIRAKDYQGILGGSILYLDIDMILLQELMASRDWLCS